MLDTLRYCKANPELADVRTEILDKSRQCDINTSSIDILKRFLEEAQYEYERTHGQMGRSGASGGNLLDVMNEMETT